MNVTTNSLGMTLIEVPAGSFRMGSDEGEFDERPVRIVTLRRPFLMAATEVTNAQYEQFDRAHRALRGARGLSREDQEPVLFVSWNEAARFCEWLSRRENLPYRLPTEAEWEYACRAGTDTPYFTGDILPEAYHRHQKDGWDPAPVSLRIGAAPPNAWGLYDMHGNVEEWCSDWYGPYEPGDQVDPVGRADGTIKVTRGGSHNTDVNHLRSAHRAGTLPEDKHWLIGFRVVQAPPPEGTPLPVPKPALWARDVSQIPYGWQDDGAFGDAPHFSPPVPYVHIPADADGPLYARHNHCPSITWCPNGDLLAIWFSTRTERGREMTIAASRLRRGATAWEPAAEFFKAPARNMTGSSLWHDGAGTLFHVNGLEAGSHWANLALVLRTSTDNGATWSRPRLVDPHHQPRNQVISGMSRLADGTLVQPCDAVYRGDGGTAVHLSRDDGETWTDPGAGSAKPEFCDGGTGGTIAGIHAGVVGLKDGRLLAFGRGDTIGGRMPQSVSNDGGATWRYSPGPWPPIGGGQRLVLLRLREGPLLFCSFTDPSEGLDSPQGLRFPDVEGSEYTGYGLFAALSFDEGQTWPVRKLVTAGGPPRTYDGGAWTRTFVMDAAHAEPRGYLAATQTPDRMIHLVSSRLYYRFNLAWLRALAAARGWEGPR